MVLKSRPVSRCAWDFNMGMGRREIRGNEERNQGK
jgi:hypothetical protein